MQVPGGPSFQTGREEGGQPARVKEWHVEVGGEQITSSPTGCQTHLHLLNATGALRKHPFPAAAFGSPQLAGPWPHILPGKELALVL